MPPRLLNCLAKAAVKHGVKFLLDLVPGGIALYDMAVETFEEYRRQQQEGDLRAEVEALAQANAEQIRHDVAEAVQQAAFGQSPEVKQAITAYLGQVPAAIRRSLRRPSDPTGTTVPATMALFGPDDLMRILPPRPPRFKPGDRPLHGVDWVLEELVGIGGFGEVWKARHAHLRSKPSVALKFCLDKSAVAAIRNEAGILDRVMQHGRHPGVVPLLNTYLSGEPPCLEYELIEGGDLGGLLQEWHVQGRLTTTTATRLMEQLAEIVAHAHRANPPIVHGDLKPANVLVQCGTDGDVQLRVTDFGIGGLAAALAAREIRQPTRSRQELLTEAVRGAYTPLYAAPEQMKRRPGELADPRDDVHALGIIWLQLLTADLGMMAVPPDWQDQVEACGLSHELIQLLRSCISSKADKRPQDAAVLHERLGILLSAGSASPSRADAGARTGWLTALRQRLWPTSGLPSHSDGGGSHYREAADQSDAGAGAGAKAVPPLLDDDDRLVPYRKAPTGPKIVQCVQCERRLKVSANSIGKAVKCPCGVVFTAMLEPAVLPMPRSSIVVQCDGCQVHLKVPASAVGRKMKCSKCGTTFIVRP